jgi:vacuolar-type H+-ATPase subunit E/Vma4
MFLINIKRYRGFFKGLKGCRLIIRGLQYPKILGEELMKYANNTSDTIQRILLAIKEEALEPSKTEAEETIAAANAESEEILFEANEKAKSILQEATQKANDQIRAAKAEILLGLKQARLQLKNDLTQNLFKKELKEQLSKEMRKTDTVAKAVQIVFKALEEKDSYSKFDLFIPEGMYERELMQHLTQSVKEKIEKSGEFKFQSTFGGVILKVEDKNMVVELTETQVEAILDRFVSDSLKAFVLSD